jgi:Flp pilus assembly protein TadD
MNMSFENLNHAKKCFLFAALLLAMAATSCRRTASDYVHSGDAKYHQGDLDGAIADYTKALELNPNDYSAFGLRAIAREKKKDPAGAVAD